MSLKLYFHPFSSFCQKVLIAFYENDIPFEPHIVDLTNEASRAEFKKIWPIGKFPVLRDDAKDRTIPESSIIIEYLAQHYPGKTQLVPADADLARQTRMRDRFYDLYVQVPMQKVVGNRLRPAGKTDPHGVELAKTLLATAYGMVDREMGTNGIAFPSIISASRLSFMTLALTRSRWARDLKVIQEKATVSLGLSLTLRGKDVSFPTLTSSAMHSRNSSAPCSRQILPAFRAMRR